MSRLLLPFLLASLLVEPASATHTGYAARHTKLERVATLRGMSTHGPLFASPLAPLGTRLCVTSRRVARPICGVVVDVPQPRHRAWQLETGRIIEVQPAVARRLCPDDTGPPRDCPVQVWIERNEQ